MTTHLMNIPINSLSPCGISEEILAGELKFRFIIGDRGNIYDVRAYINLYACTNWYWEFKIHILKNFKLQLNCGHHLRIPIPPNMPNTVDVHDVVERTLEDVFRRKIITETIQPEDFYE